MVLDTIKLKVGDYMTPDAISVDSETSLSDAISIMARKNIGHLVIEKDGKPSTILTEREILSYVVKEGGIPEIRMKDVPTKRFATVSPNDLVIEAARIMLENKKRLLVFEDGKPLGIITVSDMLRGLRTTGGNPKLDGVMRGKVYGCSNHDSIFKATKIMYSKKVGSVLVSKDEKYQGIFTERDLLTKVLDKGIDPKDRLEGYSSFPLVTAKIGIKGNEAAEIMATHKIKRLPLVENDKIKGIITARDVVDAFRRL
ncbi:MAG TPA: CBS domain-containing protein [Candidatus Nitrosotalea sp.]|nr:CBS domain-containing protein [Candidatus Nitrosotalea sp.]